VWHFKWLGTKLRERDRAQSAAFRGMKLGVWGPAEGGVLLPKIAELGHRMWAYGFPGTGPASRGFTKEFCNFTNAGGGLQPLRQCVFLDLPAQAPQPALADRRLRPQRAGCCG
jgi:hypothetical protein